MSRSALRRMLNLGPNSEPYPPEWYMEDDDPVPVSRTHFLRSERTMNLLRGWAVRTGRDVQVGYDLAHRWDEDHPRVGVDPDVYVVEPPPPEGDGVMSMKTWVTGHYPPALAVEIVSPSRPDKDYVKSPIRHDLLGTGELWIFDPTLMGRSAEQPSVRLQKFQRNAEGVLVRTYAGDPPMYSEYLNAWVLMTDDEWNLGIADNPDGSGWWLTPEEAERAAKEQAIKLADDERAAKEQAIKLADDERAAKEQALARIAELEAMLAKRS